MRTLQPLYKRTSTGAIQKWVISVDDCDIITEYGQVDGKIQRVVDTIKSGKNIGRANETSAKEQAELEAKAKWDKQIKSGCYWENIKDIDKVTFVEPMLAKNFKDQAKKIVWRNGVIVQTKFNGLRCIATANGLFTRKGEKYISVPHIEESLKKFFKDYPLAVLDGELFNYELRERLNEIVTLCRKTKHVTKEDLEESEKTVRYYVYDGYGFENFKQTDGYLGRKNWLDDNLPKYSKYYRVVKDKCVYSLEELNKIYESFLSDKQEGAIIRVIESPYENKRSKYLLKYKPVEDAEFEIIDIKEGSGPWAGIGKVISLQMENGKQFDCSFKGNMEQGRELLCNKKDYIGKTARIFYFGFTGLGTPNYAQFDYNNWQIGDK